MPVKLLVVESLLTRGIASSSGSHHLFFYHCLSMKAKKMRQHQVNQPNMIL